MSKKDHLELTEEAKTQLNNDIIVYGQWIINEAEKRALVEERNYVSDGDVREVKKPFPPIYTSKHIWGTRFLLSLILASLLSMCEAFSEIPKIEIVWFIVRLLLPSVVVLIGIIILTYIFRYNL